MEFNPDFIARMIPKVEWAALLEAADTVRTLLPASPAPCTPWVAGGARGVVEGIVITSALYTRPQGERLGNGDDLSLLPTAASHRGA